MIYTCIYLYVSIENVFYWSIVLRVYCFTGILFYWYIVLLVYCFTVPCFTVLRFYCSMVLLVMKINHIQYVFLVPLFDVLYSLVKIKLGHAIMIVN